MAQINVNIRMDADVKKEILKKIQNESNKLKISLKD